MASNSESSARAITHAKKGAKNQDPVLAPTGVISPLPITVETPKFQGSLATLFLCVREHKVDLLDVPLLPICEAYYAYLIAHVRVDLDEAASALAALAYLLERKAWMLLPIAEPEPEQDPDDPLELPPPSTYLYEVAIESLRVALEERSHLFFRSPDPGFDPYEIPTPFSEISAMDLARAFERLIREADAEPDLPMNQPRRSLSEQMVVVLRALTPTWKPLEELVPRPFTRSEAVWWFLAMLELIRLGQALARLEEDSVTFARSDAVA